MPSTRRTPAQVQRAKMSRTASGAKRPLRNGSTDTRLKYSNIGTGKSISKNGKITEFRVTSGSDASSVSVKRPGKSTYSKDGYLTRGKQRKGEGYSGEESRSLNSYIKEYYKKEAKKPTQLSSYVKNYYKKNSK